MKKIIYFICLTLLTACTRKNSIDKLKTSINDIISSKKANFGVGIYDFQNQDTLFINGDKKFVMMSVVKFPQAITILNHVDKGILDYNQAISFKESDLLPNTYSPYRDERTEDDFNLSLDEALSYTVSKSDNNVCDKLFKIVGGTQVVENYIQGLNLKNTTIRTDYANMNLNTIHANQSSPKDMIELIKKFHNKKLLSRSSTEILWKKMIETSTGINRIKGLLPQNTIVGHKTGTSNTDDKGITTAFNDVGIVKLPNGKCFAIAVFISDSKENTETNAKTIAEISKATYDYFNN